MDWHQLVDFVDIDLELQVLLRHFDDKDLEGVAVDKELASVAGKHFEGKVVLVVMMGRMMADCMVAHLELAEVLLLVVGLMNQPKKY